MHLSYSAHSILTLPFIQQSKDLNGDAVPADGMSPGSSFNLQDWFKSHGPDQTRPTLNKAIEGLKAKGIKEFAATGYCFGGRYVVDLILDVGL
jgi:dienelactone hydrolase